MTNNTPSLKIHRSSPQHSNIACSSSYKDISEEIESDFLCCQVCCEHYTESEERSPRVCPCGEYSRGRRVLAFKLLTSIILLFTELMLI